MSQFYFHLGFPKSATSFLQKNFFPQLDIAYLGKHYVSGVSATKPNVEFESYFKQTFIKQPFHITPQLASHIKESAGDAEVLLYSNEGMVGSYWENFRNGYQIAHSIKALFGEAKIILVIRRQDTFIESLYSQAIRNGTWKSVEKFIRFKNGRFGDYKIETLDNISLESLDYNALVNFYKELFGKESVLVLPYEMLRSDQERFLHAITDFLGVAYNEPLKYESTNRSDSYLLLQLMRIINFFLPKKVQNTLNKLFFLNRLGRLLNTLAFKRVFISPALKRQIMEHYRKSNRALCDATGLELEQYGYC